MTRRAQQRLLDGGYPRRMGDPALLYPSMALADIEIRELPMVDSDRLGQPDRPIPVTMPTRSAQPVNAKTAAAIRSSASGD